jgi:formate hydrogenlyase subunit 6/NADH:ubiquinone oxidoreductase subunit I
MMCGLCVEACPFDAIEMGHDYELAKRDLADLEYSLITDEPAAKPKRKAPVPAPAPAPASAPVDTEGAPSE